MPKKKKEKAEEEIRAEEILENEDIIEEGTYPESDSGLLSEDQDEVLEGEVVSDIDASLADDFDPH